MLVMCTYKLQDVSSMYYYLTIQKNLTCAKMPQSEFNGIFPQKDRVKSSLNKKKTHAIG